MSKDKFTGVEFSGDKIILPVVMTPKIAIDWLVRWDNDQSTEVVFSQTFNCHPLEGAYALYLGLKEKYGFVSVVGTPGFFGDDPPHMINIQINARESVQVPWGSMIVPNVKNGRMATSISVEGTTPKFKLDAIIMKKDEGKVVELCDLIRRNIEKYSIYRGSAFRISFADKPQDCMGEAYHPKFMNTDGVNTEQLLLNEYTRNLIDISIFTPIKNSIMCREMGIPLHRGVLLEGQYGTGKTLAATITAKLCEDNRWTFIYVSDTQQLEQALSFAKAYTPCVLFAEDVDRIMNGIRTYDMDAILNAVSGVDSKDTEIMLVLTTNHVEQINQAMLRPGRLDAVITIEPPNADTVQKLIRMYGDGALPENINLKSVSESLAGQIPAVIREVVERAKLASLSKGEKLIAVSDLSLMADSMVNQVNLLNRDRKKGNRQIQLVIDQDAVRGWGAEVLESKSVH